MAKAAAEAKQKSRRAEIIHVLGSVSVRDVKNKTEMDACIALHTLLVGEPKIRKKRTSKAEKLTDKEAVTL